MPYADVRSTREGVRRMKERGISHYTVEYVLERGRVLRRYPETIPESYSCWAGPPKRPIWGPMARAAR